MSNVVEGVSRRKLYEYMLVLESFLLEMENYVKYKSNRAFLDVVEHNNFQSGLKDILSKCVVVVNLFEKNEIINSGTDFLNTVQSHQKNIVQEIEIMLSNNFYFESKTLKNQIKELFDLIEDSNWVEELDKISRILYLCDEFHNEIVEVLQYERKL